LGSASRAGRATLVAFFALAVLMFVVLWLAHALILDKKSLVFFLAFGTIVRVWSIAFFTRIMTFLANLILILKISLNTHAFIAKKLPHHDLSTAQTLIKIGAFASVASWVASLTFLLKVFEESSRANTLVVD